MNAPIIVDPEDPKWLLLGKIMDMSRARMVKQAMARHGVVPIEKAGTIFQNSICLDVFLDSTHVSFRRNCQTECITEFPPYRRGSFCR